MKYYGYTDETGNTGMSVFDHPPHFWTCTLLSPVDLDVVATPFVEKWSSQLGVSELHANQLGVGRIEGFAAELKEFLSHQGCRVVFTRIEKAHVARLKFVDTVMDSGLNKAVTNFHYGIRFFRMTLGFAIAVNLSPRSLTEFWESYAKQDTSLFRGVVERVLWNVRNKVPDPRVRTLVSDALAWALAHPEAVLTAKSGGGDSPNMVAFSLLLAVINHMFKDSKDRIIRFVHDEQSEFGKYMEMMYQYLKDIAPGSWGGSHFMTDLVKTNTIEGPLEIVSSKTSSGLQMVDVILWLMKRHIERRDITAPNCQLLINHLVETADISTFTLTSHLQEVRELTVEAMTRPVTDEQMENAKAMLAEIESRRKSAMIAPSNSSSTNS